MAGAGTDTAGWLTAGIVVAALALRWRLCSWGLPYDVHWDEPQTVGTALRMLQDGDPHPHFLRYGTLLTALCVPVDALVAWSLFGRSEPPMLNSLGDITVHGWTFSHPVFLWANRILVAAIGTVGVAATALHARLWGGPWAGVVAAAFLAFLPVDAIFSSQVTPNGPLSAMVAVCAAATGAYVQQGHRRWLTLAFVAAGLAASFKYNGAVAGLLPIGAALLRRDPAGLWVGLAFPGCFLLGTPYALLDWPFFVNEVGTEIRHYRVDGHPGATVAPGLTHLARGLADLAKGLGPVRSSLLVLAMVLFPRAARQPAAWLLVAFAASYALLLSSYRVEFHRNWIPLYPLAALAVGVAAPTAWRAVAGWGKHAVALAVALALLWASIAGLSEIAPLGEDARHAMVHHIRKAGLRPAFPTELNLHPDDIARLPAGSVVAPLAELACGPPRDLVVPPRFVAIADHEAAWTANALIPGGTVDGPPLWLDGTAERLALRIVPNVPRAPGCGVVSGPRVADLMGSKPFPRDEHAVYLVWEGAVSTPPLSLAPGRYEVAWRLRGTPAAGLFPAWEARAGDVVTTGALSETWGEAVLAFTADTAPVVLSLAFTNDAAPAGEDRNLDVLGVTIRRAP